jgi:thiol:disulfide interchange protein
MRRRLLPMLPLLLPFAVAGAQEFELPGDFDGPPPFTESESAKHFKIRAVASHTRVTPGQTFHVALVGELAKDWVYYSPHPSTDADAGVIGASIGVEAGPFVAGPVRWTKDKPKTVDYPKGPVVLYVFAKRFVAYVPVTVPEGHPPGRQAITLKAQGQICLNVCLNLDGPNELSAATEVQVGGEALANPQWAGELADGLPTAVTAGQLKAEHEKAEAEKAAAPAGAVGTAASGYSIWGGLGLALLAGLTLNIMPCVLPIIPLRIYSLVSMAKESRRRFVTLGLAFAAGIVLFFVGLAAINVVLKLVGKGTIDVNEQFRYPWVRVTIAMILLALSANLWGLFHVTVPSEVASLEAGEKRPGHLPAVGMGLMMAVLSTPCSFWLMALALAWAQVQPLWLGTLAIATIGVGMAVPHILLASFPGLVNVLPRPGVWMEHFKKTMGFLLLPAVLWLLSTLPAEGDWPFRVAGFGAALVLALWVWGSWVRYDAPWLRKLAIRGPAVVLAGVLGWWLLPQPPPPLVEFEPFDAARIEQARKDGSVVVVKVTAKWCTECHILDRRVFNTPEVASRFGKDKVVAVKADVTDSSRPASRWVERNFRDVGAAPPLTIVYPPGDGNPQVAVGQVTKAELFGMLDRARGS